MWTRQHWTLYLDGGPLTTRQWTLDTLLQNKDQGKRILKGVKHEKLEKYLIHDTLAVKFDEYLRARKTSQIVKGQTMTVDALLQNKDHGKRLLESMNR